MFRRCLSLALGLACALCIPATAAPVLPEAASFAQDYMQFLGQCRTEIEATEFARTAAQKAGFTDLATLPAGRAVHPGDKVYWVNHDRGIVLAVIGTKPLAEGVRLLAGHIDSPRLDLKAHPVYEKEGFYQLQTFGYGGLKRYQWVNQPLELHGLWYDTHGRRHTLIIGDDPTEPTLLIPDLEPHLSKDYNGRTAPDVIGPEETDPIVGMKSPDKAPWNAADQRTAQGIEGEPEAPVVPTDEFLGMLQPYLDSGTITPTEVATGEFHLVPANTPRLCGLDRSMVAAYGQDDRSNSYLSLRAILALTATPERTAMAYLVGQEEIGSVNNTGAGSTFLTQVLADLLERDPQSPAPFGDNLLRTTLTRSWVLSADTPPAVNPIFPDVWEEGNALRLGNGPAVMKWGAGRDANPAYFAKVAAIFDRAGIPWQVAPLGKNGAGGGGTIGGYMSQQGMEVLDIGITVLSMHSPYEVSSVDDVYNGFRAFREFLATAD